MTASDSESASASSACAAGSPVHSPGLGESDGAGSAPRGPAGHPSPAPAGERSSEEPRTASKSEESSSVRSQKSRLPTQSSSLARAPGDAAPNGPAPATVASSPRLPASAQVSDGGASGDGCSPSMASPCRVMGPGASQEFSWEEVRRHRYRESCWLVARGVVYDVTAFLDLHPVGADAILRRAGRDNTEDLDFHSRGAQAMWDKYRIGVIEGESSGCVVS